MNGLESAKAAAEWNAYTKSDKARIAQTIDKSRRAAADIKAGHSPLCSLTKCHPTCKRIDK